MKYFFTFPTMVLLAHRTLRTSDGQTLLIVICEDVFFPRPRLAV